MTEIKHYGSLGQFEYAYQYHFRGLEAINFFYVDQVDFEKGEAIDSYIARWRVIPKIQYYENAVFTCRFGDAD